MNVTDVEYGLYLPPRKGDASNRAGCLVDQQIMDIDSGLTRSIPEAVTVFAKGVHYAVSGEYAASILVFGRGVGGFGNGAARLLRSVVSKISINGGTSYLRGSFTLVYRIVIRFVLTDCGWYRNFVISKVR